MWFRLTLIIGLSFLPTISRGQNAFDGNPANLAQVVFKPAAPAGTAGTIVQSKWASTGTGSGSVTLTSVASGNLVVVLVTAPGAATSLTSGDVHDGVASYTLDGFSSAAGPWIGAWSRVAGSTGSITITANPSTGGASVAINICAYEVSGLTSKVVDTSTSGNASTGLSATSGAFSTTSAGVVFGMECDRNGNTITHTATGGFSISDTGAAHKDDNTGAPIAGAAEHKSTSSSGSIAATMTLTSDQGSGASWVFFGVGYK